MFKKSITTLYVTLASVLLFTSCANSSLKTLNFNSMMDIVSSYSEKACYNGEGDGRKNRVPFEKNRRRFFVNRKGVFVI